MLGAVAATAIRSCCPEFLPLDNLHYPLQGKRVADVTNRMHVALPKPRDGVSRPPVIPSSVLAAQGGQPKAAAPRKLQKEVQVCSESKTRYCAVHWRTRLSPCRVPEGPKTLKVPKANTVQ